MTGPFRERISVVQEPPAEGVIHVMPDDELELTLAPKDGEFAIHDGNGNKVVQFYGLRPRVLTTRICPDPAAHQRKRRAIVRFFRWLREER